MPIGVYPDVKFPMGEPIALEPGDIVILPTDGILEAASPSVTEYGDDRVLQIVRENRDRPAREIVERIFSSSLKFTQLDKLEDDATVVIAKRLPYGSEGWPS
jgi:sigma-B regulation protein RsbU (phosphoserine phosphatase)